MVAPNKWRFRFAWPQRSSSGFVKESSIIGQLLYAAFAYESTPAAVQVVAYVLIIITNILLTLLANRLNKGGDSEN